MLYIWVVLVSSVLVAGKPLEDGSGDFRYSRLNPRTLSEASASADKQSSRIKRVRRTSPEVEGPRDFPRIARGASEQAGRVPELAQLGALTSGGQVTLEGQPKQREGARDFGNIARILAIAGTGPKTVDFSGNYGRRKKRASHDLDLSGGWRVAGQLEAGEQSSSSADVQHTVAKLQTSDLNGSHGDRRRRSENEDDLHGLVPKVAIHAVKVKPHGKYGNVAHTAVLGAPSSRAIFEPVALGRRKRSDFIPFSVYDQRRVKTLKIEQNDFLALPQRIKQQQINTERQKRKFEHS